MVAEPWGAAVHSRERVADVSGYRHTLATDPQGGYAQLVVQVVHEPRNPKERK